VSWKVAFLTLLEKTCFPKQNESIIEDLLQNGLQLQTFSNFFKQIFCTKVIKNARL